MIVMVEHFGLNIRETRNGLKLTRENYVVMNNKSSFTTGRRYSLDMQRNHAVCTLINFDVSMRYFESLDRSEFRKSIDLFLNTNRIFQEVNDLNELREVPGYYLLVLDEYKQAYIGTSSDMFKRIYQHWHKRKPFDRLVFGYVENSIMSIDSFRPLDTTRIYVLKTKSTYSSENKYINCIPEKFMCNRTWGGKMDKGFEEAILKGKTREIIADVKDPSIKIAYEEGLDNVNPMQLHEIHMYVLENKLDSLTNNDNGEHEKPSWVYHGKYGSYTITGDNDKKRITVKKVTNTH